MTTEKKESIDRINDEKNIYISTTDGEKKCQFTIISCVCIFLLCHILIDRQYFFMMCHTADGTHCMKTTDGRHIYTYSYMRCILRAHVFILHTASRRSQKNRIELSAISMEKNTRTQKHTHTLTQMPLVCVSCTCRNMLRLASSSKSTCCYMKCLSSTEITYVNHCHYHYYYDYDYYHQHFELNNGGGWRDFASNIQQVYHYAPHIHTIIIIIIISLGIITVTRCCIRALYFLRNNRSNNKRTNNSDIIGFCGGFSGS